MTTASAIETAGKYKKALDTQSRVILALFLRETRTRFGHHKLGIFWSVVEPLLHVAIFAMVGLVIGRLAPFSLPYILFLISGVLPFFLFRQAYSRTVSAIDANKALLVFPQIKFMDITISRVLMEILSYTLSFLLIISAYIWIMGAFKTGDMAQALFAYTLFPLMGMSLGLFMRPLVAVVPMLDRIMTFIMRLLYFASCIIIAPEKLPPSIIEFARLNPIIHALELFRSGLFAQYWIYPGFGNWSYVIIWIIVLLGFSKILEKRFYKWVVNKHND